MSKTTLARVGGLLYLLVAVFGGFAEYVRTSSYVPNDAAATAANVVQHSTLFHVAFVADVLDLPAFIVVGLILYVLLRPVNASLAVAMLVINAVSIAIQGLNMLNHVAALLIATDPSFTAGLSTRSSQALVLFMLDMHRLGYLIAQIFFGGYMLPLGYLVYRSGFFPKVLGVFLIIGGSSYLVGLFATFAAQSFTSSLATPLGLVGGLAELAFLLWLLVFGVRGQTTSEVKGALGWSA